MKQSNTSTPFTSATEELFVAEILIDLPNTIITKSISKQHSSHFSELTWTRKRRRSCLHLAAPSPLLVNDLEKDECEEKWAQLKHQDNGGGAATGTPDTPLDFQSSVSDEKSTKHFIKKRLNKRSKKQYNEMIKELTETNEVLKREVENVRKYKDNLKDLKSKYKEMKEKVLKTTVSYQQPLLIENVMAQNYPYSLSPISAQMYSSNNGFRWANHVGRFELPDLNVSVEDVVVISQSQPLDVERDGGTRYREARRMRRGLMKVKKIRNAYGIKLPEHY